MRSSSSGFSIVEALIAIAIFGVVATTVTASLMTSMHLNASTRNQQEAVISARTYFEQTRATYTANFDASPPAAPTDCVAEAVDGETSSSGQVVVKRVSLTCTAQGSTYTFALDFARPL